MKALQVIRPGDSQVVEVPGPRPYWSRRAGCRCAAAISPSSPAASATKLTRCRPVRRFTSVSARWSKAPRPNSNPAIPEGNQGLAEQMYSCMACMGCNEICPVGIRPADLAVAMRAIHEGRPPARWKQALFGGLVPHPARSPERYRVGFVLGCAQNLLFAEISCYVANRFKHQGVATALIGPMQALCPVYQIKDLYGVVLERNPASLSLLEKLGFSKWGCLPRIANFEGDECGVYYLGMRVWEG